MAAANTDMTKKLCCQKKNKCHYFMITGWLLADIDLLVFNDKLVAFD